MKLQRRKALPDLVQEGKMDSAPWSTGSSRCMTQTR